MNCTVLQRQLLSAEQPEHPAADIKSHLAQCPACRAWHRRLLHLERQIPLLPVPPSAGKAELLRHLRRPPATPWSAEHAATPPSLRWALAGPGAKERGLRKLSLAFALAAALLVFALAWWAWPHQTPTSPLADVRPDPDTQRIERALASLKTPRERFLKLADLAEEVHGEALGVRHDAGKLDRLARLYTRVVSQHLIDQARALPPNERSEILEEVADSLQRTESKANRTALGVNPRSAQSFRHMALAAADSERLLRALAKAPA